jgi:hypothetical protein
MAMTLPSLLRTIPLAALCLVGCGLDPKDGFLSLEATTLVEDYEEGREVLQVGAAVAALPMYALSASTLTLADAVAAQGEVAEVLTDPGCLTVETEGNVVRYTLDRCVGPWGLHEISGVETATFEPGTDAGTFVIDVASSELTVDGRPASHAVRAEVAVTSAEATVLFEGTFEGEAVGRGVTHEVDVALGFGVDGAVELRGSTETTVGLRGLRVELDLLRAGPLGTCVEGTVELSRRVGNLTVTLTFDGTDEYVARTNRGGRGTFYLDCTPVAP